MYDNNQTHSQFTQIISDFKYKDRKKNILIYVLNFVINFHFDLHFIVEFQFLWQEWKVQCRCHLTNKKKIPQNNDIHKTNENKWNIFIAHDHIVVWWTISIFSWIIHWSSNPKSTINKFPEISIWCVWDNVSSNFHSNPCSHIRMSWHLVPGIVIVKFYANKNVNNSIIYKLNSLSKLNPSHALSFEIHTIYFSLILRLLNRKIPILRCGKLKESVKWDIEHNSNGRK